MVIDYRAEHVHAGDDATGWIHGADAASLFLVLDPETCAEIPEPIFFADDELGCYRSYLRDERGRLYLKRLDGTKVEGRIYDYAEYDTCEIAQKTVWKPIKIVPRPSLDPEQAALAARLLARSPS